MKRGQPQITCILNDRLMGKIMDSANETGSSLSLVVRRFLDRGIVETEKVPPGAIFIPKFLPVKMSVKCPHDMLSDETDEDGNRYCTKCGEWQISVSDPKGNDDGKNP